MRDKRREDGFRERVHRPKGSHHATGRQEGDDSHCRAEAILREMAFVFHLARRLAVGLTEGQ